MKYSGRRTSMKTRKTRLVILLAVLLSAMFAVMAFTPVTASAAAQAVSKQQVQWTRDPVFTLFQM